MFAEFLKTGDIVEVIRPSISAAWWNEQLGLGLVVDDHPYELTIYWQRTRKVIVMNRYEQLMCLRRINAREKRQEK